MSTPPSVGTRAVSEAETAVALAELVPNAGRASAIELLGRPELAGHLEIRAIAGRALGVALCSLQDASGATVHLRRSLQLAVEAELPERVAQAQAGLAIALLLSGVTEAALDLTERAAIVLRGAESGRLRAQRAWILQRIGHLDEALAEYRPALRILRQESDVAGEAEALRHRGRLHAYRGSVCLAEEDLDRARTLFGELGSHFGVAQATHDLGLAAARGGDVATALECYDRAAEELTGMGAPSAPAVLDRCEVLLSARLVAEARHTAELAVTELEGRGMGLDLAEARLILGQTALLAGAPDEARHHGTLAWRAFIRQGRPAWAALARYASLRAAWMGGHCSPVALQAARDTAAELDAVGLIGPAQHARLVAGRTALAIGQTEEAELELSAVAADRRSGPADCRARAWHAEALLCHARGDGQAAEAALRAGILAVTRHRDTLGATDRRALAAAEGQELADFGTRLALESRQAQQVLIWTERKMASELKVRSRNTAPDPALADQLTQLRHLVNEVERLGSTGDDVRALFHRQAVLEKAISARTGLARSDVDLAELGAEDLEIDELADALGTAAFVEVVESAGYLHAVTVVDGRCDLYTLGDSAEVRAEMAALRFAVTRLARGRVTPAARAAAASALRYTSDRLDEVLLRPLAETLADRPLVLVPTADLHALPWSTLRTCRARPFSVCSSAALWLRAVASACPRPPTAPGETVLVAGPGLAHAEAEVSRIKVHHPAAATLTGTAANAARVVEALDGTSLAHLAVDGATRADNPLFSSLRLHGGPLTIYDLEQLRRAPRQLVFSGCDAGLSALHPGLGLSGLSGTLLSLGTSAFVASVLPTPAEGATELMVELHRRLAAGASPARALAGARAEVADDCGEAVARAAGFVCFGAG